MKRAKEARELLKERQAVALEGKHLVLDGLSWGLKPIFLFISKKEPEVIEKAREKGLEPIFVGPRVMKTLSTLKTPPGHLLLVEPPVWKETDFSKVVVLEQVQDPTNVGSILRTAYCLGYDAVYTDESSAHPFSPKVVRSSAGYSLKIPVFRVNIFEKMKQWRNRGEVLGTFPKEGKKPEPLKGKFAVVFGNESRGISREMGNLISRRITIPMKRGESLGVAASAAIVLYLLQG